MGKQDLFLEPGNPVDLTGKMKWMNKHEAESIQMSKNAQKVFEVKYTDEKILKSLWIYIAS